MESAWGEKSPVQGQVAGLRALREGGAWVERARASYRDVGEAVANELGMPPPEGSTFLFLDVSHLLDEVRVALKRVRRKPYGFGLIDKLPPTMRVRSDHEGSA